MGLLTRVTAEIFIGTQLPNCGVGEKRAFRRSRHCESVAKDERAQRRMDDFAVNANRCEPDHDVRFCGKLSLGKKRGSEKENPICESYSLVFTLYTLHDV